jgi:hypothetical protein
MLHQLFYIGKFTLVVLLLAQCNTQNATSQENSGSDNSETVESKQEKSSKASATDSSTIRIDSSQTITVDFPSEDSIFASLRRTPCFGKCPTYYLRIYEKGFVLYHGKQFTKKKGYPEKGWYISYISQEKIQAIKDSARKTGFFELNDKYDAGVTDVPATTTYLSFDGQEKEIYNRFNGPEKLNNFEDYIDEQLQNVTWQTAQINERQ